MALVLTYIAMTLPTHYLADVTVPIAVGAVLSVTVSAAVAWVAYSVFARVTHRHFAPVIRVTLLTVTSGIGAIARSYLRSFPDEEGPVPPMPVTLPLNAFFVFAWLAVGMSAVVLNLVT